jgi:2-amino-4-hydroxy-6-hydroxymethyldihydropteridine diphosphokinase
MILVAIGANLAGVNGAAPLRSCRDAVRALANFTGLRIEAVSQWYETEPVPPSGQPKYVNGMVRMART